MSATISERIERGQLFKEYLEDDRTVQCFEVQRSGLIAGLEAAVKEEDALATWGRLRALLDVKADAEAVARDGEMAKDEMERHENYVDQGPPSRPLIAGNGRQPTDGG